MMKAIVFAGSTRKDSFNRKLAREAAASLKRQGVDVTLADLQDYRIPIYDGDLETAGMPEGVRALRELLRGQDSIVIASPEYNGSFSGLLKNTIDWVSRPSGGDGPAAVFRGKRAALLSASPGAGGGRRGLRHTRELLEMIGVNVIPEQLTIASAHNAFDADGSLVREEDRQQLERVLEALRKAFATAA